MHSNTKKPVKPRNLSIFEDNNGNMCIHGGSSEMLELIHTMMKAITEKKTIQMSIPGRKLFIHIKEEK